MKSSCCCKYKSGLGLFSLEALCVVGGIIGVIFCKRKWKAISGFLFAVSFIAGIITIADHLGLQPWKKKLQVEISDDFEDDDCYDDEARTDDSVVICEEDVDDSEFEDSKN